MEPDPRALALIDFIVRHVLRSPALHIDPDTPLLSTGVLDSFALVEVLHELERVAGRRIPAGRVSPDDFETVRLMLAAAERVGLPS
ncbi:MAG TPA: acyl carrier protein [bacterium]|nr:acyl carrier protein [bacterium]